MMPQVNTCMHCILFARYTPWCGQWLEDCPARARLRTGDVVAIWKLDRMGRSLKHLVDLVGDLLARKVGLLSL